MTAHLRSKPGRLAVTQPRLYSGISASRVPRQRVALKAASDSVASPDLYRNGRRVSAKSPGFVVRLKWLLHWRRGLIGLSFRSGGRLRPFSTVRIPAWDPSAAAPLGMDPDERRCDRRLTTSAPKPDRSSSCSRHGRDRRGPPLDPGIDILGWRTPGAVERPGCGMLTGIGEYRPLRS